MSAAGTLDADLSKGIRAAKFAFLDRIEPCRPDLWRYCRSLAPTAWDADDLVQETLARAFAKTSELQAPIDDPRRWLLRVATNLWIDRRRREAVVRFEPAPEEDALPADDGPALAPDEVRDALRTVVRVLPPQERAAVVLKDVFGLALDEVASWLGTTRGAVKAALHRARTKLAARAADAAPVRSPGRVGGPDEALLDRFVAAFNARDLDRLAGLLLDDATAEVTGMVQEYGRAQVRDGSLHHTLFDEEGRPEAVRAEWDGEPIVLLWYTKAGLRAVEDVLRFETRDGPAGPGIGRLVYAYFQPEVVAEVAASLGHPWRTNGYRYAPRPS